eukprot:TRINITY_DN41598_c0_g1_i1.p1 TRINITY_DN41598_c0_g1~~TRINITY_DN41598_c0_g1_i1.p1  ORF type:complete len:470 (-),score=77.56 TRINITY_DN41598_c0_g1_i1:117-1526(-)
MEPTAMEAQSPVAVVVVPFPAQGHLNQLLHLSRLLSTRGLPVHYIGSATHNRQAKLRAEGWDPSTNTNIHFHDISLPFFPTPPPDPNAPTKFPEHLLPAFEATDHLRHPFTALLRSLSATYRRIVVINDPLMAFSAHEASNYPYTECYQFQCSSAFCSFFFTQDFDALGKPTGQITESLGLPVISLDGCFTPGFFQFLAARSETMKTPTSGRIFNSCRPIEGRFLDLLSKGPFFDSKTWAIGPLNPIDTACPRPSHWCLEWLDKQPPKSVIYVSFGTMSSISDEQIHEIATGLERSEKRFVWVVREADKGDIFAREKEEARRILLPQGYEERVREVGRVMRDWAPQLEILRHPSVGGFMSHCGWNSSVESMSMGVPIAAWPMHSDQPRNAMLVTEVLKIGVMVSEWSKREELVTAEAVENAVRRLMESDEGKEIRKRAEELGKEVRGVWSENGSSHSDFDSFISHISRE